MAFLLERDALNGKSGKAFLTENGRNQELFSLKKFQSDAEFQESDFKVVGTTLVQKKTTGVTLTGTMTIYYGTPLFLSMLQTYLKTGRLPYFTVQVAEWLEEEVSFSYTNVEVLNAFHNPDTLGN